MKIKHVYGNVLRLDIPLTVKIITSEGGHTHETEEPFYPDTSKSVLVELANKYNITKYTYEATMNGNVAHIEDYGDIKVGIYKVTVKCYDEYSNPYRYMVRDIIEVCDATIDAGIEAGVEFNAETYTLEGAVFVSYGGGSFEQVQADWTEADINSKAYIKHKPTHIVEDESYVHTDNNYTDEEKEKLADLENYDDSGIRQEIDGKVDKVAGKGLSTNDYTDEDKQKVNSALQSETDPTVPQWAKQPQKPTYTAQEVGALPNSTKYGSTIDLSMDSATYVLTLSLKDQDGTVLNTKTVDLPIESAVVNGRYDAVNKKIVLTLQSGSTIDVPVGDLIAGLQTEITSVNMLDADLVDDTNSTHKFVTAQDKTTWDNKYTKPQTGIPASDIEAGVIPVIPSNTSYFSNYSGVGIVPEDGIRAETVANAATMSINPDVLTLIDGTVGTATITLQVPNDSLAHVWDILMTTDSSVAVTFAMSNGETILTPSGFSLSASKAVEISVIGKGTKYYLRYGEFA